MLAAQTVPATVTEMVRAAALISQRRRLILPILLVLGACSPLKHETPEEIERSQEIVRQELEKRSD